MVVDSSALIAILLGESEAEAFARLIAADAKPLVGTFTLLEASVVMLARKGEAGLALVDALIHAAHLTTVALSPEQAQIAATAYSRFGKGRHPAGLNLGDCCSYALAQFSGEPLLFKGEDFPQTDVVAAA